MPAGWLNSASQAPLSWVPHFAPKRPPGVPATPQTTRILNERPTPNFGGLGCSSNDNRRRAYLQRVPNTVSERRYHHQSFEPGRATIAMGSYAFLRWSCIRRGDFAASFPDAAIKDGIIYPPSPFGIFRNLTDVAAKTYA